MKRILSVLLALVMVIGLFPVGILSASAAEVSETMTVTATSGTLSGKSISWTSGNLTFTANQNTSSTAIRTSDTDHFRLYVGFSATIKCSAGNITKIVMTSTGSSYAIAPTGSDGSVGTVSGTTITIVPSAASDTYTIPSISKQTRIKSITVTYATVDSGDCAHANTEVIEAKDPTCTVAGNTAGMKCADCGEILEGNETIDALGHSNDDGVVTAATCTTDGYTLYTCTVCGSSKKDNYVDATGHNYVDGVCSACGTEMPTGLNGKYYIAAKRSTGNYFYMTNDLGTASTSRYQIVDSGLTELPASIEAVVDAQVFEFIFDAATATYKIKTGDKYLGWTSGNSGTLVDETAAIAATIDEAADGAYNIHFTADAERYLALNNNSGNNYFAWYKQGQAEDLYLIPVSTSAEVCTHANTTVEGAVAATCTTAGSTGTAVCSDCGATVTEATVIDALGHNYVDGTCTNCGEPETTTPAASEATISFATLDQRVSLDTSSQVWANGGLTLTNNKGSSTTNVASYSNPVRFYKSSDLVFAFTGMTKIVVTCNSNDYATALVNSVNDSNAAVSADGKIVTISLTNAVDSFTVTLSGGQVRMDSVTVYASSCEHNWSDWVQTSAPTCDEVGVNTSTCSICGETKTENIPALGHNYTFTDSAITCSACDYSQAYTLTTLADARAAAIAAGSSNSAATYYIKGIVTYISDKNVYIEDATGGFLVYFTNGDDAASLALGDEILVWDTVKTYNGLTETSGTTSSEFVKGTSGNALPVQNVTLADLLADSTKEYLCERVTIEGLTIGVLGTNNTALTDANGNTINIYKAPALSADINENDTVTVTAIVSAYNAYQLLVNPGTAEVDVVETASGEVEVIETVTIAEAKVGTVGEYYQVEGTVSYISGRNVYIQDATGGIVVYLTANAATTQVGDTVKAYGALKNYNGLLELDAVDETNVKFYEILSSGSTVEAQNVTIADLNAATDNTYLAEKVVLENVYISHYSYNSSYKNVNYNLIDSNGNTIQIYRVDVDSEDECYAGGSIVNVEAVVSAYVTSDTVGNGYQLSASNDMITVVGTCAHETTETVNYEASTCTTEGYSGDTMCTVCNLYTARGEKTPALGHDLTDGICSNCGNTFAASVYAGGEKKAVYATVEEAYAAYTAGTEYIVLNTDTEVALQLTQDLYIDLNGHYIEGTIDVGTCKIYGMDSATNEYGSSDGYMDCSATNGSAIEVDAIFRTTSELTGDIRSYMAIEGDNGWTFNRYYLGVQAITLKTGTSGIGYKAAFYGNQAVCDQLNADKTFGFTLSLEGGNTVTRSLNGITSGRVVTLRINNYDVANFGTAELTAQVSVTMADGSQLTSAVAATSMKQVIETLNADTTLTDIELAAVSAYVEANYEVMKDWAIGNLYTK